MRRVGYALFVLAAVSVVICLISVGYAITGPEQKRSLAWGYGIVNLGFAIVNGLLGLGLLAMSRSARD
jgi:uncharacterized membrane protein